MMGKPTFPRTGPLPAGLLALALAASAGSSQGGERTASASATAQQALQQATGVAWIITTDPDSGAVTFAVPKDGAFELPAAESPAEAGLAFLSMHRRIFGMQDPEHEWVVARKDAAGDGSVHIRFAQAVNKVPVYGSVWDAHFDAAGRLTSTSGNYVIGALGISTQPRLSAAAAAARARLCVAERANLPVDAFTTGVAELEIFPRRNAPPVLAWRVMVSVSPPASSRPPNLSRKVHLDDRFGAVIADEPTVVFMRAPAESGPRRTYPEHCLPKSQGTP